MGSYAGAMLADLALGRKDGHTVPLALSTLPRRFPFGRYRRALLPAAYAIKSIGDS